MSNQRLDAAEIKRQSTGRCCQILRDLCSLSESQVDPTIHQPCPKCGGKDRYRALDDVNETGGLLCNQACGTHPDIFSSVMWLRKCDFREALQLVADSLGVATPSQANGHLKTTAAATDAAKPAKRKKVHATEYHAFAALRRSYAENRKIDMERWPDHGWYYHNADGSEAGAVGRWNLPDGNKTFGQIAKVDGGWICGGMHEPRPLLNLPAVIAAESKRYDG